MAEITINKHVTHTNNTLIFGQLNSSIGVPSLVRAIAGQDNWGKVVGDVYSDDESRRLAVDNIRDVIQIFKPTYYFSVAEERIGGVNTKVVEHTLQYREAALPVEITPESLGFRIAASEGKLDLRSLIRELHHSIDKTHRAHMAAITSRNPATLKDAQVLRSHLVSQLTEPVVAYLVLAESTRNYVIESGEQAPAGTEEKPGRYIKVLVPRFEEGNLDIGIEEIFIEDSGVANSAATEGEERQVYESKQRLLRDVRRQGREYLAAAVKGYLTSSTDEAGLPAEKEAFVQALTASGVAEELMIDDITPQKAPEVFALLSTHQNHYLLAQSTTAQEQESAKALAPTTASRALTPTIDNPSSSGVSQDRARQIRAMVPVEKRNRHIQDIGRVVQQLCSDDEEKRTQISTYLHTLTPAGELEVMFTKIRDSRSMEREMRGERGFELYLDLCLEEASEKSQLIKPFREVYRNTLLQRPHRIKSQDEERWQAFHDLMLQAARATFEDYIEIVSPLVGQLMGIEVFLKTVGSAVERKPRVLIANVDLSDLLDDEDLRSQFEKFVVALDSFTLEEFERAIAIVVAPKLAEFHKEHICTIGFQAGFLTFMTPETSVGFNELNEPRKLEQLVNDWSSRDNLSFQSGVLCVPDHMLLPAGFRFRLGEFYATKKTCDYVLDTPIIVPACFQAAALVARNDDPKFVREALKCRIRPEWPCLGMIFGDPKFVPLWTSDTFSNGVILERYIEGELPLCVFEHSKDRHGRLNKQRLHKLNTLYISSDDYGDRAIPAYEYRMARYLDRLLSLNWRQGALPQQISNFCSQLKGVWDENYENSIINGKRYRIEYDRENGFFSVTYTDRNLLVTKFPFRLGAAAH